MHWSSGPPRRGSRSRGSCSYRATWRRCVRFTRACARWPEDRRPGKRAATPRWVGTRLTLGLEPDGRISYAPAATDWHGAAALVAAEILLAQQRGQWERFKACPAASCGVAFYDESKNGSRIWHDVRTCGNQANLQAYRARRKASKEPAVGAPPSRAGGARSGGPTRHGLHT